MRRIAALLGLLLLAACQGGGGTAPTLTPTAPDQVGEPPNPLQLEITAAEAGDLWRVTLQAPQAQDLYQLAGTLVYDPALYTVATVEAGGGLGGPEESYFVWGERAPGRIDFAYTRRYYGTGASGPAALLSVRVNPIAEFALTDFTLDTSADALLARDSLKRVLEVNLDGGVQ
jgi:hypothetical protein